MNLEEYSKFLGFDTTMEIESLVESHKHLVQVLNDSCRKEWKEAMDAATQRAYNTVLDSRYILISELKDMTISEVAKLG